MNTNLILRPLTRLPVKLEFGQMLVLVAVLFSQTIAAETRELSGTSANAGENSGHSACCNKKDDKAPEEEGAEAPGGNYKSLRYQEDYRYLKSPLKSHDAWDPAKYIPLGDKPDWYLTVGGEMRQRYEFFHNEEYGEAPADGHGNNSDWLQRYKLHGDLHLGSHVRLFTQFMSTLEDWRKDGPRPETDQNEFDIHQGFIDLAAPLGEHDSVTFRLGRQELEYGSGRLVSGREAPNNRRSFDAARFLFQLDNWSVDSFWGKPVRNRNGVFDDDPNPDKSFWGIYAVTPWRLLPDGHADLYYLGFENRHAIFDQGKGYELRHTVGTRIWGNPLPWKYNFEFLGQFGHFADNDIAAWAVASDTHYSFANLPLKPQIGLRADITSGDSKSSTLGTYNPLFPTGAYFNLADLGGPSNFIHIHPTLDLSLTEKLKASFDWGFFWRQNTNDALYSISTTPIRSGKTSHARYTGSSPAVVLAWEPVRHVTFLASYVHFFTGDFFKAEPVGKDVDYFTTWVTYKF